MYKKILILLVIFGSSLSYVGTPLFFIHGVLAQYDSYGKYIGPPPGTKTEEEIVAEIEDQKQVAIDKAYSEEVKALENKIKKQEEVLAQLKKEAEEQAKTLKETKKYANTLSGYISSFNNQLRKLEGRISIKKEEILSTQLAVEKVNLEIDKKESEIERMKMQMTQLMQEIYKNDEESILELVFKYESFSAFFNQVQSRKSLQFSIDEQLQGLKKLKQELVSSKEKLDAEKDQLGIDAKILRDQRIILEQKKINQRELLKQTKGEQKEYQNNLNDTLQKEKELRQEIFDLEDRLRQQLDPNSIPQAGSGVLQWPVEGLLTQGYGCINTSFARSAYPGCDGGAGGFHNGLDIASWLGKPIHAAQNGIIKAVESSPFAYGYWVAIEHPNGLITTYAHMSSIRPVSVGQNVELGQTIGYMDSSGYSTGSHTHFMVYAPESFRTKPSKIAGILPIGATLNPFDYLP